MAELLRRRAKALGAVAGKAAVAQKLPVGPESQVHVRYGVVLSRLVRWWQWAVLAVLVVTSGCNAPPVKREAEIARFRSEMQQREENLAIDAGKPLTMEECEELALSNSLELRVRELALRLEDDQVRLALSNGLPRGSLRFEDVRRSNEAAVQFGEMQGSFEDRHQQRLAIQVTAPVLDFGSTYYAYKIAVDNRRQERLLLERARQLLRRDVRVAYALHAGALRQQRLAAIAYQAAQHVLRVARSLEAAEMAVRADTALVEAAVAEARLALVSADQRVEETHLGLKQLMSLPPGVEFRIIEEQPVLPPLPTAEEMAAYEERALAVRPELAVQDLERHIAANEVRRQATDFFPKIDALGSFNWSNASVAVNPSYFLYGYSVAHSLLDGGATIWRYSLAKKAADVQAARSLLLSLGVVYEVEFRALRLKQAHETLPAAQALERSRREGMARILSLYKEGLEDEAGAARALADLTIQATALDRAQTDYQVAWYEFEAAVLPERSPTPQPTTRPSTQPTALPDALLPAIREILQ